MFNAMAIRTNDLAIADSIQTAGMARKDMVYVATRFTPSTSLAGSPLETHDRLRPGLRVLEYFFITVILIGQSCIPRFRP